MTLSLRRLVPAAVAGLAVAALAGVVSLTAAADPPAWAYPVNPPDFKPRVDDGTPRRVPDSTAAYTVTQLRDLFAAPVWHPEDHPPLPPIVAHGRKPAVFACGVCHRADGPGGPENANIAGLPAAYIVQQMADYKSGARTTAMPDRAPQKNMIALSKAITDDEVREARGLLRGADAAPERPRGRDRGRAGHGGRRLVPGRCEDGRPRADRPARDRSAREPGAVREPRHALALHRLRAAGEHRARRRRWRPASPARRTAARSATGPT